MSRTYATLEVSAEAYDEIAGKLMAAGYGHAFIIGEPQNEHPVIDMHGIALVRASKDPVA